MAEPMMKGAVLREFVDWYEARYGKDRMRALADRLPDDLRSELDPDEPIVRLLGASWYPARLSHLLLDTLTEGMSEAQIRTLARESTRHVVARGAGGIYGFVLRRLVTPEIYALSVPRLWRQLHSTGDREVTVTSAAAATSSVRRWSGHHPVLCTFTIETMCAVFEVMGKTDLRWERTACVSRGSKECVTLLTWST